MRATIGTQSIAWAELFVHELSDHPTDERLSDWSKKNGALHADMADQPAIRLYGRLAPHT